MSETLNDRLEREARALLGMDEPTVEVIELVPEGMLVVPKPSMFVGVQAWRVWRLQRKTRKMAKKQGKMAVFYNLDTKTLDRGPGIGKTMLAKTHDHGGGSHTHSVIEGQTHTAVTDGHTHSARRLRGMP